MIPHKLNPMGMEQDYPLMVFKKDGNLFDKSKAVTSYVSQIPTGVRVTNIYYNTTTPLSDICKPNTTYYIHCEKEYSHAPYNVVVGRITLYINGTGYFILLPRTDTDGTFTTGDTVEGRLVFYGQKPGDVGVEEDTWVDFNNLYIGTEPYTEYQPYNPNTYSVYGQSSQEARSVSKNLLHHDNSALMAIDHQNGKENPHSTKCCSEHIRVDASVKYTISRVISLTNPDNTSLGYYYYDSDKNYISGMYGYEASAKYTLTTPENCAYMRISYYVDDTNVQLELGSEATEYQPYVANAPSPSPNYPSPILSNYPKGIYKTNLGFYIRLYDDLRGIGEYRDKITYNMETGTKVLTKNVENIRLGTNYYPIVLNDFSSTSYLYYTNYGVKPIPPHLKVGALCTHFAHVDAIPQNQTYQGKFNATKGSVNTLYINGYGIVPGSNADGNYTNVFNQWLDANGVSAIYPLAAPTTQYL